MNESRAKPIVLGGKVLPRCSGGAIAMNFETITITVLNAESRCQKAHQAVKDRVSADGDFMSDAEIKEKLTFLDLILSIA